MSTPLAQNASRVSEQPAPAPIMSRPSESEYRVLKAREKELKNQLNDVQDRRDELSSQLTGASTEDRTGLVGRINVLDVRLRQIEADLGTVGHDLAETAPASISTPPPRTIYQGYNEGALWISGFMGAGLMFALLAPYLWRTFLRKGRPQIATPVPGAIGAERIDRMEHAIESIAVEIERVSENQRFMTRLMTETQLAGTIAAVRGSAEAAKAAAVGADEH